MKSAQWQFTPDECVGGCGTTSVATGVAVVVLCLVACVAIVHMFNKSASKKGQ